MEVGSPFHHRQEIDALRSGGSLDGWNEPMQKRTQLGTLECRHSTEIQQMPPSLDNDRPWTGFLKWGVLNEEVLTFDYVATRDRRVQEL